MQFFTPTVILLGTISGFLLGFVWYSPLLFMKAWLIGEGIDKKDLPKRKVSYLIQINVYSFIAHSLLASVLALIFDLLHVTSLKVAMSVALLITFGFIVTIKFIDMIYTTDGAHYNFRAQVKFLVGSGYYLSMVSVMSFAIFSLAQ
jgi:hypothetical protein